MARTDFSAASCIPVRAGSDAKAKNSGALHDISWIRHLQLSMTCPGSRTHFPLHRCASVPPLTWVQVLSQRTIFFLGTRIGFSSSLMVKLPWCWFGQYRIDSKTCPPDPWQRSRRSASGGGVQQFIVPRKGPQPEYFRHDEATQVTPRKGDADNSVRHSVCCSGVTHCW